MSCEKMCSFRNLKHSANREADQSNGGLWYSYGANIHTVKEKVCAGGYLISKSYTEDKREKLFLNHLFSLIDDVLHSGLFLYVKDLTIHHDDDVSLLLFLKLTFSACILYWYSRS